MRPLARWGEVFDREGVRWAPTQTTADVVANPQGEAAGPCVEVPATKGGTVRMLASPELGYDWEAIGALKEKGAIP
ncbi:MAG: hypothetical protein E6J77_27165 [Deltaproteobacteria bacterium]|nr:MAG: hypothetical protein E6J77_27165 [Deltaproteobacteria bacterium]